MEPTSQAHRALLFISDIVVLALSLWLTLLVRYLAVPELSLYLEHLQVYSAIILFSSIVFYIAGLYEKDIIFSASTLFGTLLKAQFVNSVIAIAYFYFHAELGITPKTSLLLYLPISIALLMASRSLFLQSTATQVRHHAILVGRGNEAHDLYRMVNSSPHYSFQFDALVDLDTEPNVRAKLEDLIADALQKNVSPHVVIDLSDPSVDSFLPLLYSWMFSKVQVHDFHRIYEAIFDRIPLSLVTHSWFLENISTAPKKTYDFLKRCMDIFIGLIVAVASIPLLPFVLLAIKLDDGGPILVTQDRVGQNNRLFRLLKFRSMSFNDQGQQSLVHANKVTRVGRFLRATRIDELPQIWNVLKGDISLIGPRPELPALVEKYEKEIPYYRVRHLIKPGLSGWAQLYHKDPPKVVADIQKTRLKLAYDLYYIKSRSLMLDLLIALRTTKVLMQQSGT